MKPPIHSQSAQHLIRNLMHLRISILVVIASFLTGCGGPKYQDDFREWLSLNMASAAPVKLEQIKVEEVTGGNVETVFLFSGQATIVQDLYSRARLPEQTALREAVDVVQFKDVASSAQGREAIQKATELLGVSTLKIATKSGTKGDFSGRAKAVLQNDGKWAFQVLEVGGMDFEGDRPAAGSHYVVIESSDAEEHVARLSEQTELIKALIEKDRLAAEQKLREEEARLAEEKRQREQEERRLAEEAKARLEAFLPTISPGHEIIGIWQGTDASGKIGLRFGEHRKMPDGYTILGELYDPNQNQTKSFQGNLKGDGSPDDPFTLDLIAAKTGESDYRQRNPAHNQTAAFLLPSVRFGILLRPDGQGGFAGEFKMLGAFRDHPDNPNLNFSDERVPVLFPSDGALANPPSPQSQNQPSREAPSVAKLTAYTPERGSAERAELIDMQRTRPKSEALYVVKHMKVLGDWACTVLVPTHPQTGQILADAQAGIFQRVNGRWQAYDYQTGIQGLSGDEAVALEFLLPEISPRIAQAHPHIPRDILP